MRYLVSLLFILFTASTSCAWQLCGSGIANINACAGTFGITTTVGTEQGASQYQALLLKIDLGACTGSNPTIYAYLGSTAGADLNFIYGIYDDDGGSGEPGTLLYESTTPSTIAAGAAKAWRSEASSVSNLTGVVWVGVIANLANLRWIYSTASGDVRHKVLTSMDFPATWDTAGDTAATTGRHFYVSF